MLQAVDEGLPAPAPAVGLPLGQPEVLLVRVGSPLALALEEVEGVPPPPPRCCPLGVALAQGLGVRVAEPPVALTLPVPPPTPLALPDTLPQALALAAPAPREAVGC